MALRNQFLDAGRLLASFHPQKTSGYCAMICAFIRASAFPLPWMTSTGVSTLSMFRLMTEISCICWLALTPRSGFPFPFVTMNSTLYVLFVLWVYHPHSFLANRFFPFCCTSPGSHLCFLTMACPPHHKHVCTFLPVVCLRWHRCPVGTPLPHQSVPLLLAVGWGMCRCLLHQQLPVCRCLPQTHLNSSHPPVCVPCVWTLSGMRWQNGFASHRWCMVCPRLGTFRTIGFKSNDTLDRFWRILEHPKPR